MYTCIGIFKHICILIRIPQAFSYILFCVVICELHFAGDHLCFLICELHFAGDHVCFVICELHFAGDGLCCDL